MASKGWSVLLVMLGMLVGLVVTGTVNNQAEAIVQISPQGSAIIFMNEGTPISKGDVISALKERTDPGLGPHPLLDMSDAPLFHMPTEESTSSEQLEAVEPVVPNALNCDLYH